MLAVALLCPLLVAAGAVMLADPYVPTGCNASEPTTLRVGVVDVDFGPVLIASPAGVRADTFEGALIPELCNILCAECELVLLKDIHARITALQNDEVDFVVSVFSATSKRAKLVDFVRPFYYAAGVVLFMDRNSKGDDVSWEDANSRNMSVCLLTGYYAKSELADKYDNISWVFKDSDSDMQAALKAGECTLYAQDSVTLPYTGYRMSRSAQLELPAAYTIPVAKGNTALRLQLSGAMTELLTQPAPGTDSRVQQLEGQLMVPKLYARLAYLSTLALYTSSYVDVDDFCAYSARGVWGR